MKDKDLERLLENQDDDVKKLVKRELSSHWYVVTFGVFLVLAVGSIVGLAFLIHWRYPDPNNQPPAWMQVLLGGVVGGGLPLWWVYHRTHERE